jgi:hypothetical protein
VPQVQKKTSQVAQKVGEYPVSRSKIGAASGDRKGRDDDDTTATEGPGAERAWWRSNHGVPAGDAGAEPRSRRPRGRSQAFASARTSPVANTLPSLTATARRSWKGEFSKHSSKKRYTEYLVFKKMEGEYQFLYLSALCSFHPKRKIRACTVSVTVCACSGTWRIWEDASYSYLLQPWIQNEDLISLLNNEGD